MTPVDIQHRGLLRVESPSSAEVSQWLLYVGATRATMQLAIVMSERAEKAHVKRMA